MEVDGWVEARRTMRVPSPKPPRKTNTRARISLTLVAELSHGRAAEAAQLVTKGQRGADFFSWMHWPLRGEGVDGGGWMGGSKGDDEGALPKAHPRKQNKRWRALVPH